jgi:uracil-DNA glycosylase
LTRTIEELLDEIQQEAERAEFPIDIPVYERAHKDPKWPILFAGSLDATVCVFARDLGKDEVRLGQPLIGAGGKLVRQGLTQAWKEERSADGGAASDQEAALRHALLTNTVPFKPPGNKAYAESVKNRFRPFVLELLTRFWKGHHIITLGTEAFQWFEPYIDDEEFQQISKGDQRFRSKVSCKLPSTSHQGTHEPFKQCFVRPLPHPSPLNRRWYSQFPEMLADRLREIRKETHQ